MNAVETMSEDNPEASDLLARAKEAEASEWKNPDAPTSTEPGDTVEVLVASTNLNVRAEPSTTGAKIGLLEGGSTARRAGPDQDGWTPIELSDGTNGFVATQYLSGYEDTAPAVGGDQQDTNLTLASVTRSVPSDADTETRTVAVLYEGREKRIELDRLTQTAEQEENTAFTLDG